MKLRRIALQRTLQVALLVAGCLQISVPALHTCFVAWQQSPQSTRIVPSLIVLWRTAPTGLPSTGTIPVSPPLLSGRTKHSRNRQGTRSLLGTSKLLSQQRLLQRPDQSPLV